jgi:hypothetical protein
MAAAGLFAGGMIIAAAVVAGTGLASAQTPDPGEGMERPGLRKGLSPEEHKAHRNEKIDQAVANGRLTPEQGERLKNAELGENRGIGRRVMHAVRNVFGAAAEVIGISPEDLKAELKADKTLTQIAQDRGVSRDALESGITQEIEERIQQALSEEKITSEQAGRLREGLAENLDKILDHSGLPKRFSR